MDIKGSRTFGFDCRWPKWWAEGRTLSQWSIPLLRRHNSPANQPCDRRVAGPDTHLSDNVSRVDANGFVADSESHGNLSVGVIFTEVARDLTLPSG